MDDIFHNTPPIEEGDFELGISNAIIENVKRLATGNMTSRQKAVLERMKYRGTINIMKPENYDDFWKWFGFFNDLDFGGLLNGLCRLEIFEYEHTLKRMPGFCEAYCSWVFPGEERDPRFKMETPDCLIAMCDYGESYYGRVDVSRPRFDTPFVRARDYLDTLLHEMLHAIFKIYECNCGHGCLTRLQSNPGGHEIEWQAAALEIEKSVVLGWHPDLSRTEGLVSDVHNEGNLPNAAVLRSLDLNITEILRVQAETREAATEWTHPYGWIKRRDKNLEPFKTNTCIRETCTLDATESTEYRNMQWRWPSW